MEFQTGNNCSWILKAALNCRKIAQDINLINLVSGAVKFPSKIIYKVLQGDKANVEWRKLFFDNMARPRAKFVAWMLCNNALNSKDKLLRIGISTDLKCTFCAGYESIDHLFFECPFTNQIWSQVLKWMRIDHKPAGWGMELNWIISCSKGKSNKAKILKGLFAETAYHIWIARNESTFQAKAPKNHLWKDICQIIIIRCGRNMSLQKYIAMLES